MVTYSDKTAYEAISDSLYAFLQSLDDNNDQLMRSVTSQDIVLDATLFAELGLGPPEPLVGQDNIVPALLEALTMTTTHYASNIRIDLQGSSKASFTAYVLAYHYKKLEEPRESPRNNYVMGNRYEGTVEIGEAGWKLTWLKFLPAWQSGNIAVMGIGV